MKSYKISWLEDPTELNELLKTNEINFKIVKVPINNKAQAYKIKRKHETSQENVNVIYLPDCFTSFLPTVKDNADQMSNNLHWAFKLLATVCETRAKFLVIDYIFLESLYMSKVAALSTLSLDNKIRRTNWRKNKQCRALEEKSSKSSSDDNLDSD